MNKLTKSTHINFTLCIDVFPSESAFAWTPLRLNYAGNWAMRYQLLQPAKYF